jgi:hypothetical protein
MNNTHVFNVSGQCMLTLVTTFFGYILIGTVAISKYESGSSVSPTTLSRGGWWSLKHTNKNVDIKFSAPRKIGKPNNFKTFGAIKLKVLNKIAKIGKGHLCLIEGNLSFNNNYII